MSSVFCALPFYRTTVRTNGGVSPCCYIKNYANISTTNIEDFWQNNIDLNQLRSNMLLGKESADCKQCYEHEKSIGTSMRIESLRDHAITSDTNFDKLVQESKYLGRKFPNHLEFHIGNLCNLKCLTCRPEDSSSFLIENKILGISNHDQKKFQTSDHITVQVLESVLEHGIEVLDLRGGESMLMPSIRKLLNRLPANHNIKCLRLQTNCTVLDDFWKQMLQRFDKVEIMMSIDAHGSANNYIRYPSNWEDIEKNVEYFLSLPHAHLYVNCTISNINFLVLAPLIEWCRQKRIYFHHSICSTPNYYHYTNLPTALFETGLEALRPYQEVINLSAIGNDSNWNDFCQMIDVRDDHRGNSIFSVLPEFKKYWKKQ
jgi:MoaA/NifB/PqqE/SkfB family radical SAM enzyme